MKFSRTQLARNFVQLLDTHPHHELIRALAIVLIEQGRANEVELVVHEITRQLMAQKQHLAITITTARPASSELSAQISNWFKSHAAALSTETTLTVDPSIIGGLIATTPDYEFDASLRTQLRSIDFYQNPLRREI